MKMTWDKNTGSFESESRVLDKSVLPNNDSVDNGVVYDAVRGRFVPLSHESIIYDRGILSIPAVWGAVDFLAGTLASLPLRVYDRDTHKEITGTKAAVILNQEPGPYRSSFDWRYALWKDVFTYGRHYTYISRDSSSRLNRLHWNIEPSRVQMTREDDKDPTYRYQDANGIKTWKMSEVIDIAWMRTSDELNHVSPLSAHKQTFELAVQFEQYQKKFAKTGGVPPFVLKARWSSPNAIKEGLKDFLSAVRLANRRQDMVVPVGKDMEVAPLGVSPEQGRVLETQQFIVRQICRIFDLPPIYLHDLGSNDIC